MQIKVTYNKTTKEIAISNDIEDIVPMELNTNSVIDTDTEVSFEIAVNTSTYEMAQSESIPPEEIIE